MWNIIEQPSPFNAELQRKVFLMLRIDSKKALLPAVLTCVLALTAASAFTGDGQAPPFDLPSLGGDRFVSSADLFGGAEGTFLVFWDSGCTRCVEALRGCEAFHGRIAGGDIQVVGIAGGETGEREIRGIIESASVTFPQLRDRGRLTGAAYGVGPSTFSIFLVDGDGMVVASAEGAPADPAELMEEMLMTEEYRAGGISAGIPDLTSAAGANGFVLHGKAGIKFLSVDTDGENATGPYGEELGQGNSLLQRYELEIFRNLGRNLRVGGLLRISNEGIEVLRSGPEYYDSRWGSVFAEGDYGRFGFRLGYFTMHMTPLTMMRWDWDDNPRTGGDAGCGCGAAGGILIVESLEELGPGLTFEGALVRLLTGEFETDIYYAMPRRARDIKAVEWQFGGEETAAYPLEIFGLTSVWQRHDSRTGSNWSAGLHLLAGREDPESIDPVELGYVPFERYDSEILTFTLSVPVIRHVDILGEWIAYDRARGYNLGPGHDEEDEFNGYGGIAGIKVEDRGLYDIRVDYLRLSEGFYSPFAALSYEPGRHGPRVHCRIGIPGGWPSLQVLYKRLYEIEGPGSGAEKDNVSMAGVTLDSGFGNGAGGSLSWLDRKEWRGGGLLDFDDRRRTYTATLRYRFGPEALIEGMYQRIDSKSAGEGPGSKTRTDMLSVYLRAAF